MPHYMPVMLNLEGRRCVIVGGGTVATRKAAALTEAGAVVTVISPGVTAWLQDRVREGEVAWLAREYREGDLKGAFLVFAATDSRQVNDSIVKEAEMLGIPVNDTADGARGSFITPSVVRRGKLVIGVSTSGVGPAAARELCREIDRRFGDTYERYVEFLSLVRTRVKQQVEDKERRKRLLARLGELDILPSIRQGGFTPWSEAEIAAWIEEEQRRNSE